MAKSAGGGSKADTAVKLMLIFFISLLSFTVGTLVGGQFEKSKSHQLALELDDQSATRSSAHEEDLAAQPISDEELDGLDEFVKADRNVASADKTGTTATTATATTDAGKDGYTHASRLKDANLADPNMEKSHPTAVAAERVANDKAPAADPKPAPQPEKNLPMVASSTIGKFTVQVASYATEKEAEQHATKLKEKGFNAFYIPATINGKTWYRVSVGRFPDQKTAMSYRKELLETQAATSAIVQKVVQ